MQPCTDTVGINNHKGLLAKYWHLIFREFITEKRYLELCRTVQSYVLWYGWWVCIFVCVYMDQDHTFVCSQTSTLMCFSRVLVSVYAVRFFWPCVYIYTVCTSSSSMPVRSQLKLKLIWRRFQCSRNSTATYTHTKNQIIFIISIIFRHTDYRTYL